MNCKSGPIRIGLIADEPIPLAGLASIFDQPALDSHAQLIPVIGGMLELLSTTSLKYLVVDMQSSKSGMKTLQTIRRARPDIRLIVVGPPGDDQLVLTTIIGGARAYLDLNEGPEMLRTAVEAVTEGTIWAPRRVLSRLIDQLLEPSQSNLAATMQPLTAREHEVLELILLAHSNREIASQLGIEERTVRAHLARLMRKAGVDNRIKLSMSARNLLQLPQKTASRMDGGERARRTLTN